MTRSLRRLLCLTLVLTNLSMFSQPVPEVVPPAPNAAALAEYADIPASKYTGVPSISIPLYTINTGGYQLPISISYHASGIQVAQEASSAGLGWALNAGGVITRQIRGIDDFNTLNDKKGFLASPALPSYNDYYNLLGSSPNATGDGTTSISPFINVICPDHLKSMDGMSYVPEVNLCSVEYIADTESDMYSFNFMGYSGKFVVNKDGSTILLTPENGLLIKVINTNSWEATTNDGTIYRFAQKEYTTPYSYSTSSYTEGLPYSLGGTMSNQYISSWYLSQILLTNGETIDFNYEERNTESWNNGPITVNRAEQVPGYVFCGLENNRLNSYNLQYSKSSSKNTVECYLHNITWAGGTVNISYLDREDILCDTSQKSQRLDEISVKKLDGTQLFNIDGTEISNIKFNTSYFNNQDLNGTNDHLSLRLKLDSVTVDDRTYAFSYINPNSMPKKYSNSTDHWGYFNNQPNLSSVSKWGPNGTYYVPHFIPELMVPENTMFTETKFYEGADRTCNPAVITNGMLQSIEYPTKGVVSFEYEPNDFELDINAYSTSYGLLDYEDRYEDVEHGVINYATASESCSGCYVDSPYKFFTLTETTSVTVQYQYYPYGSQTYPVPTDGNGNGTLIGGISRTDGGGSFSQSYYFVSGDVAETFTDEFELAAGTYILTTASAQNYTIQGSASYNIDHGLPGSKEITGGGVRIKKIISDSKTREFSYGQENDPAKSSGLLLVEPYYGYFNYNYFDCFIAFMRGSSPMHALSDSGATVGYSYVRESVTDQVDTSTIATKYKNHIESRQRSLEMPVTPEFDNGLLLEETYLNNSRKVYRKVNTYQDALVKRYELYDTYFLKICFDHYGNYSGLNYYRIQPEWWQLASTITEDYFYDASGNPSIVSKEIDYEYNGDNYQVKRTTATDSRGNQIVRETSYTVDYTSGIYATMQSKNMTAFPVESVTQVDGKVTDASLTTYNSTQLWPDGEVQIGYYPYRSYSLLSVDQPTPANFDYYDGVTPSPTYYKKMLNYKYDLYGNVVEHSNDEGVTYSYLWGYDRQYPVVKVENATYNSILALLTTAEKDNIAEGSYTDSQMRTVLDKIRTGLPGAMVTTLTYDPLIGVTSITDARGMTTYYGYDGANRLETVKDLNSEILGKNIYNYKQ